MQYRNILQDLFSGTIRVVCILPKDLANSLEDNFPEEHKDVTRKSLEKRVERWCKQHKVTTSSGSENHLSILQ